MKTALADLPNFTPIPEEFSTEDKVIFEQAFSFHGKSFARIRQMLPDKSNKSLVEHYYKWKKSQNKTSVIDEKANHRRNDRESSNSSDEETKSNKQSGKTEGKKTDGFSSQQSKSGVKGRRKPPKGMHLSQEDLVLLASGPSGQGDAILQRANADLIALKQQVQTHKQALSKFDLPTSVDRFKVTPQDNGNNKVSNRWTNEETLIAIQCIKEYGRNYTAIADVIGTKTETHVKNFIVQYKSKYNLEDVLKKHDEEMAAKCDAGPPPLIKTKPPLQSTPK